MFQPEGSPIKYKVRGLTLDGKPWFVAKDVAAMLGYANTNEAISTHCKGGRETLAPSPGGLQKVKIIPESDVYRLVSRSKLPAAEAVMDWLFEVVLPTLRQTGSYVVGEERLNDPHASLEDLDSINDAVQQLLQRKATMLEERVAAQALRIEEMIPKERLFNQHVAGRDRDSIARFARTLPGSGI